MTNEEAINAINAVRYIILRDPSWLKSFTDKVNEAVNMAINALTAQPVAKDINVPIKDCISRQAAIDAVANMLRRKFGIGDDLAEITLAGLPSAQPETHEERTETHECDLISRQAAIDAILAVTGNSSVRELYEHVQEHGLSDMWSGGVNAAIDIIIAVPPAQPEPCEDAVSRDAVCKTLAMYGMTKMVREVRKLPPAQPDLDEVYAHAETEAEARFHAEIVRCKDCKHHHYEGNIPYCDRIDYGYGWGDDDYCSRAERRTDERTD